MRFFQFFLMLMVVHLGLGVNRLCAQNKATTNGAKPISDKWQLVFSDEFNTNGAIDATKWGYCPRGGAPWSKFLTAGPNYAFMSNGNLTLRMDNAIISGDNAIYHSCGIQTSAKFSLTYGKVEVRAKFNAGKGSWPAIWMMPEKPNAYGQWPNSGEIDIMEHVNSEKVVHHTLHNQMVTDSKGHSTATHPSSFNADDFNTYAVVWTEQDIRFFVNDTLQYTYRKAPNASFRDWPYDKPFYLILNQSGGAGWPGPISDADLPFIMEVDWVRIYKSASKM